MGDKRRPIAWPSLVVVVVLLLTLGACATPPKDPEALAAFKQTNDPIEPLNRAVFEFNLVIDKVLFRPIAFVYKEALPNLVQDFIRNFLNNLRSPVIFANDLLQGEFQRAEDTAWRALINSTFGIGGINDLAAELGILPHDEDFGQTLAVAGLDEGPYLMMPILGPTNPRDGVGLVVDIFFDPLTYLVSDLAFSLGRLGARGIDLRARAYDTIDELERTSLDYYATVRSLHRQRRNDEIRNNQPPDTEPLPDISIFDFHGPHLAMSTEWPPTVEPQ